MEEDSILYRSSLDAPMVVGGGEWEINTGKILKGGHFLPIDWKGSRDERRAILFIGGVTGLTIGGTLL